MGDASSFIDRIDALKQQVGEGVLTGELERDQVYAHYQEANLSLKHPNGGQAMYQESSLYDGQEEYFKIIAERALEDLNQGMADAMEAFDKTASQRCPKETTALSRSGHPTVKSNGAIVYDRAPEVPRLSEEELRAMHPGGHRYGG